MSRVGNVNQPASVKRQLEALGATQPPAPRPEFADALLNRLLEARGFAGTPASSPAEAVGWTATSGAVGDNVVPLAPRRRSKAVAARVAAAASIAAVSAGVLGVYNMVDSGGPTAQVNSIAAASDLKSTDVTISAQGLLLTGSGAPAEVGDGPAEMSCSSDMSFFDTSGNAYQCEQGSTIEVTIRNGAIVAASIPTTIPKPATMTLNPPEIAGDRANLPLQWTWERYDGPRFGLYRLVRTFEDDTATSPTPEVVAEFTDVAATAVTEAAPLERIASYQLLVLAPDGTLLARSNLIRVKVG